MEYQKEQSFDQMRQRSPKISYLTTTDRITGLIHICALKTYATVAVKFYNEKFASGDFILCDNLVF